MAQYIKFRVSVAKVGVSMALLGLIAALAEGARSMPTHVNVRPAAVNAYLKLNGVTGASRTAFLKLDSSLLKLEKKLAQSYYTEKKVNSTFLKISDASHKYLKIREAAVQFLKITDASNQFLKLDGTAANAGKLGGLTPDAFLQGHGNVLSAEAQVNGSATTLLGDGSILVNVSASPGGNQVPAVQLVNGTAGPLSITINGGISGGQRTFDTIQAGGTADLTFAGGAAGQMDVQIFGGPGSKVWTLTVSAVPSGATTTFVGQLLIGLL